MENKEHLPEADTGLELRKSFLRYLPNWYWFVITLIVFLGLAYIYTRYKTPLFAIKGTLLIKEDKGNGLGSEADILDELNLTGSSKNVKNEVEILSSKTLMDSVVENLHLTTSYFNIGIVKVSELYNKSPIQINAINLKPNAVSLKMDIIITHENEVRFRLSDIEGTKEYNYGDTINRPYGEFVVNILPYLDTIKWSQIRIVFSSEELVCERYLKSLKINETNENASVVELDLLEAIPQKGIDIINKLVYYYQQAAIDDKNRISQQTINFIDTQLNFISVDLSNVENNIEKFKKSNDIADLNAEATLVLNNVSDYDKQLSDLTIKTKILTYIKGYLENDTKSDSTVPSTLGIDDPTLLGLINNFNRLQLEKDHFIKTTGPSNPLIQETQEQINQLRGNILEDITNLQQGLSIAEQNIQNGNGVLESEIQSVPEKERELIVISRQKDIEQDLYVYLLQKRYEAELSLAATISNSRVIDAAYSSPKAVRPIKSLFYFFAVFFGFLLPGGFIYFKELFNTKITSERDILEYTDIPILGAVSKNYSNDEIVVREKNRTALAEQFRLIRTNLDFLTAEVPSTRMGKVFLITSSMSQEGKSFFTVNLGISMALAGKRTAVLEFDLRKPKLSEKLGLDSSSGISNYLIGNLSENELIKKTRINENLYLVSSGPIPPNPGELLLNSRVARLFDYLKEHFEAIIIDTPPVGLVADTLILSKYSDSTLYLVRNNFTYKHQIGIIDSLSKQKKLRNVAIIYNSVKPESSYSYGYGYGYYEEDRKGHHKRSHSAS